MKTLLRLIVATGLSASFAIAESHQWTNASGGNWNDAANWTPSHVPDSGDTATIPGGNLAIVIDSTVSISGLTLGGGSSLTIASGGTFNILGNLTLDGPLTNAGTVNWQDGDIAVNNYSHYGFTGGITNQVGGLFNIRCDRYISRPYGSGQFINAGTLRKSAGTGITEFSAYFDNSGAVESLTGTLRFNNGTNLGGTFQAATDAVVDIAGSTLTLTTTPPFQGPGTVKITTTYVTLDNFSGTVDLTDANVSGQIAAGGLLNLYGGWVTYGSSLTVASAGVFNILGDLTLYSALSNSGTVNWQDGNIYVSFYEWHGHTGKITNQTGGLFDIRCDRYISLPYGSGQFINTGTLRKSAGAGNTEVSAYFDNSGAVECLTGTLRFNNGTNLGGTFQAATDAVVDIAGSYLTLATTPPFQGPGVVRITTSNVMFDNFSGTVDLTDANVSGQIAAGGILNLHGGRLSQGSTLTIASGGTFNILGDLTLRGPLSNSGTVNWQDGNIAVHKLDYYGESGEITNQAGGLFDIRCDRYISLPYGSGQFINTGTLRKSAGAGNTEVSAYFDNSGAVEALTGTIRFNAGYSGSESRETLVTISPDMPNKIWITGNTPASFGGKFTIQMEDGYRPNPGDTFPVISYGGALGDFTCLNGLDLGNGLRLEPHFGGNGLTLVATTYKEEETPTVNIIRAISGVFISWPIGASGWELHRGTDLSTWEPTSDNGVNNTVKPTTEAREFFRLQKP